MLWLLGSTVLLGQSGQPATTTIVPKLVRINSSFHPVNGSAAFPVESATLSIYAAETGGTALWRETQNVSVAADGHYSVLLGATTNEGLPMELFASGEPRWLGVQFQSAGEIEQPRVLLASVPYALKAADAETLGGRPASAYMVNPTAETSDLSLTVTTGSVSGKVVKDAPRFTSSGSTNGIPVFTDPAGDIGNSVMYQNVGKIGVGTTNPLDYMHVAFTDTNGGVTGYAVQNLGSGSSSYSGMLFYDQSGSLAQFQGFNNSSHEYRINNIAKNGSNQFNGSINFMIGSSSKLLVWPNGDVDIPGSLLKNGSIFLHDAGGTNTALGLSALAPPFTGGYNTAIGFEALQLINSANFNTAIGAQTLQANDMGYENTAVGEAALLNNSNGSANTAVGYSALSSNTTGETNTGVGIQALQGNTTGSFNTALGYNAGVYLTTGSYNITIGNHGSSSDDHLTRIGEVQTNTYIAGIAGVSVSNAATVLIDTNSGHLGTINSSRRYKEDIQDMGDISTNLLHLRPVTFRYKQAYEDGSKPLDYGLIAEEVAEIYPDLIVRNKDGQIQTVQYHKLTPMLLNELQKEHRLNVQQNESIRELQAQNCELQDKNRQLENRLAALEALLLNKGTTTATTGQ